jgi:hypothetical protein
MSNRVLSMVTGSLFVEPGRVDIGLNIKFSSRALQVLGYTRRIDRQDGERNTQYWELSDRAIALVVAYQQSFPRVFQFLEQQSAQGQDSLQMDEMFPEAPMDTIVRLTSLYSSRAKSLAGNHPQVAQGAGHGEAPPRRCRHGGHHSSWPGRA